MESTVASLRQHAIAHREHSARNGENREIDAKSRRVRFSRARHLRIRRVHDVIACVARFQPLARVFGSVSHGRVQRALDDHAMQRREASRGDQTTRRREVGAVLVLLLLRRGIETAKCTGSE